MTVVITKTHRGIHLPQEESLKVKVAHAKVMTGIGGVLVLLGPEKTLWTAPLVSSSHRVKSLVCVCVCVSPSSGPKQEVNALLPCPVLICGV